MSLSQKFGILVILLALTVLGSQAAAAWAFHALQSEIARPFASMSAVLRGLTQIKMVAQDQSRAVRRWQAAGGTEPPGRDAQERVERVRAQLDLIRTKLAAHEYYARHAGISTTRNLDERLDDALRAAGAWAGGAGGQDGYVLGEAAAGAFERVRELVERMENTIEIEAEQTASFLGVLRAQLLGVLAVALVLAALICGLALLLVRRWVITPVAELRLAAARIAQGDFDHRIPAPGRDEIAHLAREVNYMAGMVRTMLDERVERERLAAVGQMARRIAHNIRNPLAGIRGLAELTRSELPERSSLADAQGRIIAAVDQFERWLAALLRASSPLSVQPEPASVGRLLTAVAEAHRPLARTRGVALEVDAAAAPDPAIFDASHLEHAVSALVCNAIEASPPGGTVRVQAGQSPAEGAWEICISDEGPGVPAEIEHRIFEPYFTTKRDGTGIGLAVALQVARAHGGTISVHPARAPGANPSANGSGAVFAVRLPLATATGTELPAAAHHSRLATGGHHGANTGHRG